MRVRKLEPIFRTLSRETGKSIKELKHVYKECKKFIKETREQKNTKLEDCWQAMQYTLIHYSLTVPDDKFQQICERNLGIFKKAFDDNQRDKGKHN